MGFSRQTLIGLLVQGSPREAVAYLRAFPLKRLAASRIEKRMTASAPLARSRNAHINEIDAVYQQYYKSVFWNGASRMEGAQALFRQLLPLVGEARLLSHFADMYGGEATVRYEDLDMRVSGIEELLKLDVEKEGYHFLGGKTQGYFGPYIWRRTKPAVFSVALPAGSQLFTVQMMEGFVSRSWLDFISLGKVGTGGWAAEGQLFCVKEAYKRQMYTPAFRISYLKHEAQHVYDQARYPGLSSVQLEYRAKLTELICYPNMKRFKTLLAEASAQDEENTHALAAHQIVRALSQMVFGEAYVSDYDRWKGRLRQIREGCKACYAAFPSKLEECAQSGA